MRICLRDTSPFATDTIVSVTPHPMNGARTITRSDAGFSSGGTSPTDVTRPTTTTGAAWSCCWKVRMAAQEQANAGDSVAPSNARAAEHVHQNLVTTPCPSVRLLADRCGFNRAADDRIANRCKRSPSLATFASLDRSHIGLDASSQACCVTARSPRNQMTKANTPYAPRAVMAAAVGEAGGGPKNT